MAMTDETNKLSQASPGLHLELVHCSFSALRGKSVLTAQKTRGQQTIICNDNLLLFLPHWRDRSATHHVCAVLQAEMKSHSLQREVRNSCCCQLTGSNVRLQLPPKHSFCHCWPLAHTVTGTHTEIHTGAKTMHEKIRSYVHATQTSTLGATVRKYLGLGWMHDWKLNSDLIDFICHIYKQVHTV